MKQLLMVVVVVLVLTLCSCAVSRNLDDGYEVGDVTGGVIENYSIYCSAPLRGIRAVGRFVVVILGGVVIPDVCALIGEQVDQS